MSKRCLRCVTAPAYLLRHPLSSVVGSPGDLWEQGQSRADLSGRGMSLTALQGGSEGMHTAPVTHPGARQGLWNGNKVG